MPISKERLNEFITCGEEVVQVYITLANMIEQTAQKGLDGHLSPTDALETILSLSKLPEYPILKQREVLIAGRAWWNYTHGRNERERLRQERQRREAGQQPLKFARDYERKARTTELMTEEGANDVLRSLGYDDEQIAELDRRRAEQAPDLPEEEPGEQPEDGELFFAQSIPTRFDAQSKEDEQVLQLQKDACSAAFAVAPQGHKPSVSWTTEAKPTVRWFCQCSGFAGQGFATEEDWKEHIMLIRFAHTGARG